MWATLSFGYWLCLLLAVPAAGFLVRLFMIQHDCGHGAFFRHRLANDWVGRAIGILTLTPYDFWRRTHAIHHANSGNLARRGIGDIKTLTVREYLALSRWGRLQYRLYRHPIIMFGVGPAYLFILQHRLPIGLLRGGWQPWFSAMATNAAIATLVAIIIWFVGVGPFLLVHLPIHASCGFDRGLAVLRPAPVRGHALGTRAGVALPSAGSAGQLLLRAAAGAELVHGQHRPAPHPPPLQSDPELPAGAGAAPENPELAAIGQLTLIESFSLRPSRALGRRSQASHLFPRDGTSLHP